MLTSCFDRNTEHLYNAAAHRSMVIRRSVGAVLARYNRQARDEEQENQVPVLQQRIPMVCAWHDLMGIPIDE